MKTKKIKAFSLVELLVVMAILSFISAGIYSGLVFLGKNAKKIKDTIIARSNISNFSNAVYNFGNKSKKVYFLDSSNNEMNYLEQNWTYRDLNRLYFEKSNEKSSTMMYDDVPNPSDPEWTPRIVWTREDGTSDVILTNIYRKDAAWDETTGLVSNAGTAPLFRFPHSSDLYDSRGYPLYFIVEFKVIISAASETKKTPETLNCFFVSQVNTLIEQTEFNIEGKI